MIFTKLHEWEHFRIVLHAATEAIRLMMTSVECDKRLKPNWP